MEYVDLDFRGPANVRQCPAQLYRRQSGRSPEKYLGRVVRESHHFDAASRIRAYPGLIVL
jgi:hypothetical protein